MSLLNTIINLGLIHSAAADKTPVVNGGSADLLSSNIAKLKAENDAANLKAEAECKEHIMKQNVKVEGYQKKVDPQEFKMCIEEKKKKLEAISSKVESLIQSELSKPIKKPCIKPLDSKVRECYTKMAMKDWLKNTKFSFDVFKNITQIWDEEKQILLYMIVMETPKYEVIVPPQTCKSFFKKPTYKIDVNNAGDMIKSAGKPNKRPTAETECKPCSEFATTTEGKYSDCDNTCSPLYFITSSSSAIKKIEGTPAINKAAKKETKENKEDATEEEA